MSVDITIEWVVAELKEKSQSGIGYKTQAPLSTLARSSKFNALTFVHPRISPSTT